MTGRISWRTWAVLATAVLWSVEAGAFPQYHIQKEAGLYGSLNQNLIPIIGPVACGPAAAINSFVYLESRYPHIYDRSLVPDLNGDGQYQNDELIAAAQVLAGPGFMGTTFPSGTYHDDFIWGKWQYIESLQPRRTTYQAQDWWQWNDPQQPAPSWVDNMMPSWQFIYEELTACEDVEVLLVGAYESLGHYLTLTSFHWDDLNGDGILNDGTGNNWIDYIDPWTGLPGQCNIWQDQAGGQIFSDYFGSGQLISYIGMAISESPIVPVPAAVVLCTLGAGLVGYCRRKRML